ncbi:UDP-N-acetylmuramoyl-tripeptide--D-alanyl-D-alanine ligase [Paracoccus shanxieyensis]|uniref:UDP-N-acetylmuramoyl-tripeptide--D-alanyl-D-alanine ligase n=1 Tax=Paracoccus shanxieyensis TaxID=2675752 RepID=A0A6L6IZ91_9RHOB|nr:UDP-N-acetylmuramoyl-tripeptide--D-alanyl-D-alanine ligase [Paracoccus shanxieyensis]MTH64931.1 UDP-N-acetylmuramoyl-tripeptide--D-alanyl-D-alanine ligase [Paracoccus shanxieyensis]MTH88165.1 UDP-N-acetylmuramoyl-tripeptide--D-alanyl-D-alanine ligase [Paracoccus shanxieyensis]
MILWTSADAAAATGGRATRDFAVTGVSIDTRTIRQGDLFVALQAARDGHDFVAAALAAGAAAALVSRIPEGVAADAPLLVVDDVLTALEALGRAGRARMQGRVIGITGSVGKTSTKEMARIALTGQGVIHAAEASYNNHWGVPLTLARMPADTDFAIIEIGMNHPGEIEPLARLARPHVAMITTVAAAHLEAFGAIEGIAREKGSIFRGLVQPGTAIIPEDLPVTQILRDFADASGAIVVGFGAHGMARPVKADTQDGITQVRARILGETVYFTLATAGTHFVMNAVGVLAALSAAGADLAAAGRALSDWRPPLGRGALEDLGGIRLIDDAYNSNPTSLSAGLATLARLTGGRRVAILGDMLELGPDELAMHAAMAEDAAMALVDLVHTAGPRMRALHQALPEARRGLHAETAAELASRIGELVAMGDIVLVKGSKSSKVSTVVDALRRTRQSTQPGEGVS